MEKALTLSAHIMGKTITIKRDTNVIHVGELFNMFKTIIVSEFGERVWEDTILTIGDDLVSQVKILHL